MTRMQMSTRGAFVVDGDPDRVVATALAIATSPRHAPVRAVQLAPGGDGYVEPDVGWIGRVSETDDPDDAPEDTWTLCRAPDAKLVLDGPALRALVDEALALRRSIPRTVTMTPGGNFTVTDDAQHTIGNALVIATAPQHADVVDAALRPGGSGLSIETFGSISPVTAPEDLDYPFDQDPTLDPRTQELWRLFRDSDREYGPASELVLSGDELRALVDQARALRAAR